jgi:hypothetical protein
VFIHISNVRAALIKDYGEEPSGWPRARTKVQGFPLDTGGDLRARI